MNKWLKISLIILFILIVAYLSYNYLLKDSKKTEDKKKLYITTRPNYGQQGGLPTT